MRVKDILKVKGGTLFSVRGNTALQEAIKIMSEMDIGSVLVMDGGKLVGLLTFREVMTAMAKGQSNQCVEDVMVRSPFTVTIQTELEELRRNMLERHSRYVPVFDGAELCGVISFFDVARAVVEDQERENQHLRAYIHDSSVSA